VFLFGDVLQHAGDARRPAGLIPLERPRRVLDPDEAARRVLVPIDMRDTLDASLFDVPARLDDAVPVVRMHTLEPERS